MTEKGHRYFNTKPEVDPYAVLGIERAADDAAIQRAYFQQVRKYPPEQAPAQFQAIRHAYEQLRDSQQRALTDLFLLQPPPERPNRRLPSRDLGVYVEDLIVLAALLSTRSMADDVREVERPS